MTKKNQHVVPLGRGWAVRTAGSSRLTIITDTKKDAVEYAKGIAKRNGTDLIIHSKDGTIRERNSFAK
ncbi:MAG: hypothetical protein JWQ09_1773 [Segetibacter sp.]|nr:hypothetical protein [Segetibacter sp.]